MPLLANLRPQHLIVEQGPTITAVAPPNPLAWQMIHRLWTTTLSSITVVGLDPCAAVTSPDLVPLERWNEMRLAWDVSHLGDNFQGKDDDGMGDEDSSSGSDDEDLLDDMEEWLEAFDVRSWTFPSRGVTVLVCNDQARGTFQDALDKTLADMGDNLNPTSFRIQVKDSQRVRLPGRASCFSRPC